MNHPEPRADHSTADHSATAPEHTPRPGVRQAVRQLLRRPAASAIAMLGMPGLALAGPEGGNVVRGAADITRPDANTTTIDQFTNRAVINWDSFNVGGDEYVIFNQLDASSIVLNRVLGGDASIILGHIQANGQVFLLNPQGVFFGEGASIDVQGFLASTLDMNDDDFMNGDFTLSRTLPDSTTGQVVNEGTITAGEGGYVLLAGDFTENTGVVTAMAGTVALVSGNELTLNIEGDGLVNFSVNADTLAEASGVRNAGSLIADGGMVVMTARVANDLVATAVNNEGLVRARSIENKGGEIYLVGHGGDVEQSGTLDASGENGDGGQMMVWGDKDVTLHDGGVQTVDGAEGHDAGDARFIAQEHLDYQANNLISADGETGGMIEVSGHGGLTIAGTPVIGPDGELIIDPQHIAITRFSNAPALTSSNYTWASGLTPGFYQASEDVTSLGRGWIEGQLGAGVTVTLVASETITYDASINSTLSVTGTNVGDLTMQIGSVASIGGASTFGIGTAGGVFGGGTVTVNASTDLDAGLIDISGLTLNVGNVNFTASIVGGGTTDSITLPDITASNITVNGGSASVNGAGGVGSASLNAGNNISITGGTIQNFYVATAQNATFNGDIAGSNFYAGTSTGSPGVRSITVNGNINVTNQIWLNASSGITVTGNAIAQGGSLFMRTAPFSNSAGDITIAGNASAGLAINLSATGPATNGTGGNISIGSGMFAGGNISVSADGAGASSGGNISLGNVDGASVNLTASDGAGGGGNMNAGNISGDTINLTTWGYTSFAGRGNMTVGNIVATGAVTIDGNYGNSYNIGDITGSNVTANFRTNIGGTIGVSLGSISANNNAIVSINQNPDGGSSTGTLDITNITTVSGLVNLGVLDDDLNANGLISIANGISAGGNVIINDGPNDKDVIIGAGGVSGDNVSIEAVGHNLTLGGNINANGFVGLNAAQLNITGQDIIATGNVGIFTSNSIGTMSFGDIAGSQISINLNGANIVTGSLSANNSTGLAVVQLDTSGGNITVNGDLTVSGVAGGTEPFGAIAIFNTQLNNSNSVTVTGTTTLTGNAGAVTGATNAVNGGTETISGSVGGALLLAETQNGTVNFGDINVSADGFADIVISGQTIDVGNVTANVAAGSYTRTTNRLTSSFSSSATETVSSGGGLNVDLIGDTFNSAAITLGNISLTGPQVGLNVVGFDTFNGGSVNLTATGVQSSMTVTGSDFIAGSGFSLNETRDGGGARLVVAGEPGGGSVNFGGDINVSAQGGAIVDILSDVVSLQNVDAVATGGTFARTGSPNPYFEDKSPFGDGEGGGPRIDEGTINGSEALIRISSQASGGTIEAATSVSAGDISVTAMGSARIEILAQTVNAGNITGNATLATRNGTFDNTFSSGGSTFQESGSVSGSYGEVDIVIENGATAGNVTLGNVTLNGPVAGGHIDGANVTMGAFSLTGTGINLDVNETRNNLTAGTSKSFTFQGDALITGMGLNADNNLQTGDINVSGVGAAGTLLSGVSVQTGNVTINVTDADVVAQQQNFFGGALTSFTAGDAVFGIDASSATVNGNMNVTATGVAQVGGTFDVTGDVAINAARGYDPVISQQVQFLNGVRDEGGGGNISLPGAMNIGASNISISATSNLDLSATTLGATGTMDFSGANIRLGTIANVSSSFTINAGNALDLNGQAIVSDDITLSAASLSGNGASLDANNVSITTTGAMDLSNTVFSVASNMSLTAGTNIKLTNIAIDTGTLLIDAGGNITNSLPPGVITADALAITAGGNIFLPNITFNIGSGSVAGVTGDTQLLSLLNAEGVAPSASGPNASFSGTAVSLGTVTMSGSYLYVESNDFSIGSFAGSDPNTLVQLTSLDPAATIGVEDQPAATATVNYSNTEILSAFAGLTIAIGSTSNTGDMTIGENGTIDIGSTNFFALSQGTVTGIDKIISTGIVKDLNTLLGVGFEVPQTDEIDVTQNTADELAKDYATDGGGYENDEEEEEGDEEGEDTEDETGIEEEDDSLIRQDTIDEELTCS